MSANEENSTIRSSLGFAIPKFTYAFQPIVDVEQKQIISFEALIRGENNEPPPFIFSQINKENLLKFDQIARERALELAATLGINCCINLNFSPACLQFSDEYILATIASVNKNQLNKKQLVIELTEEAIIHDMKAFSVRMNEFRGTGIKVAIDDFGAGYSGLNLLINFQPDMIKLDMQLIRNIDMHGPRQAVVNAIVSTCVSLGIDVIAEGVETLDEYYWLTSRGVFLFQGFLFARPGFESLPEVDYPPARP